MRMFLRERRVRDGRSLWGCAVLSLCLLCAPHGLGEEDTTDAACVKGAGGELRVGSDGLSLRPSVVACPAVGGYRGGALWTMLLQKEGLPAVRDAEPSGEALRKQRNPTARQFIADDAVVLTDRGQSATREVTPDGFRLRYAELRDGSRAWRVSLTLEFRRSGLGFEVTGTVANGEKGWLVCGFDGPALDGIRVDLATCPALLADAFGRRVNGVPTGGEKKIPAPWQPDGTGYEASAWYPGQNGTMPWCALAGTGGGLYLGCHDRMHGSKIVCLRYDAAGKRFGLLVRHQFFCADGKTWTLPTTVIRPYEGSWHAAAKIYRAWADAAAPLREPPEWVQDASGWLMCIMKQQNGEVLWNYASIEKMCDAADRRGLDMLGLYGWSHGGHDTLYPDYVPDAAMGGREGLMRALALAHRRGKRVILYANGQLEERGTEFWNRQGRALAVIQKDGTSMQERWRKFKDAAPHAFDLACLGTSGWYDRMLSLALQANELGADGILYDQLGVRAPMACYASGHGHPAPAMVYTEDRAAFMRRIVAHMKTVNPEFIVMTESMHDSFLDSVSLFWANSGDLRRITTTEMAKRLDTGCVSSWFPELFRYTYPEVMSTVREPRPMLDRCMVNYACVYGFRFEIEARYAPDVRYLSEGRTPEPGDYEKMLEKPDLNQFLTTPPDEAARYLKCVSDFQRTHAGLLRRGLFADDEGFAFSGAGLVAKGYRSGSRLGVVVWNPTEYAAPFTLRVPDAELEAVSEPERERADAFSELAPQTVRLFVWKKR